MIKVVTLKIVHLKAKIKFLLINKITLLVRNYFFNDNIVIFTGTLIYSTDSLIMTPKIFAALLRR